MKDFRLYDIMDFVMDEDFIRWVQEKRPADEAYWNQSALNNAILHPKKLISKPPNYYKPSVASRSRINPAHQSGLFHAGNGLPPQYWRG